jgi:hypothetical protein
LTIKTRDAWPQDVPLYCNTAFVMSASTLEWFQGLEARAYLRPRFDLSANDVSLPLIRWVRPPGQVRAGMPPTGAHELEFDFVIELAADSPGLGNRNRSMRPTRVPQAWRIIHRECVRIPVQVRGQLKDFVIPDSSTELTQVVRESAQFDLHNSNLDAQVDSARLAAEGFTCPVVIELLRDGKLITTWDDCWHAAARTPMRRWLMVPSDLRGDMRPFGTRQYADFKWSLRVSGNPGRALLDAETIRCWTGEFTEPLHLVDQPNELVFRSSAQE